MSPIVLLSRSEEHTSELQSRGHLVCRLLLEKKNGRGELRDTLPGPRFALEQRLRRCTQYGGRESRMPPHPQHLHRRVGHDQRRRPPATDPTPASPHPTPRPSSSPSSSPAAPPPPRRARPPRPCTSGGPRTPPASPLWSSRP